MTIGTNLFAQESPCSQRFEEKTIQNTGAGFTVNKQSLPFTQMKTLLAGNTASASDFAIYKKGRTASIIFAAASTALIGSGLIIRNANKNLSNGFLIAGVSLNVINFPITLNSKKHLRQSIYQYNKSVL